LTPCCLRRIWHHAVCHFFQCLTPYPGANGGNPLNVGKVGHRREVHDLRTDEGLEARGL
jgi:hypothetical protein